MVQTKSGKEEIVLRTQHGDFVAYLEDVTVALTLGRRKLQKEFRGMFPECWEMYKDSSDLLLAVAIRQCR